jgi:regulator of sigma E protease
MHILLLVLGLVLFIALVVVHEFGHFIVARRNNIEVEEFGIGFPPRAKVLTKKNGTVFTLNWLPLGGFVKLKGEHDADTEPGTFGAANLMAKIKVMLAGVLMNLLVAFGLLSVLSLIGMPKIVDNQFTIQSDRHVMQVPKNEGVIVVEELTQKSPAAKAGIRVGDRIISIGEVSISQLQQVGTAAQTYAGKRVEVVVQRDNKTLSMPVNINSRQIVQQQNQGYLGVTSVSKQEGVRVERNTWSAPFVAGGLIKQFTELTFKGLGGIVSGLATGHAAKATEQVSGPVGIFVLLKDGSLLGFRFVLMIIAIISLTLAIMNVLPIPALDGGRLFVTLLFRAIRKPLTQKKEEWIHGSGFVALMILFVLVTIVDIRRFF